MKKKLLLSFYAIAGILSLLAVIFIILPENSCLFRQNQVSNQPQLGTEIIKAFKENYKATDSVIIATERIYIVECGTGLEYTFSDQLAYKYHLLSHKNVLSAATVFNHSNKRKDKIILAELHTYLNDTIPSDYDIMSFNGISVDRLKSKPRTIFLLNFDVVKKDKIEVSFRDYNKNLIKIHFTFILKNGHWKPEN